MGGCCSSSAGGGITMMTATSSYPGNKRIIQPSYQPPHNAFEQVDEYTSVAKVHFVTCPGGNALKLVGKDNVGDNNTNAKYISVTLPPNVHAGDVIHVHAPDGRLNAVIVPEGMGPGSTFTVEFAQEPIAMALPITNDETIENDNNLTPGVYVPTVVAEMEPTSSGTNYNNNNGGDNNNNMRR